MKQVIATLLLSGSTLLASCGFQPLYSDTASLSDGGSISIPEIEGRSGHILRRELRMLLKPGLPDVESGLLEVTYREARGNFPFKPDNVTVRSTISNQARYKFTSGDRKIVGIVDEVTAFSVPADPYADITAQVDAKERAARQLAELLVQDLILRLSAPAPAAADTEPEPRALVIIDDDGNLVDDDPVYDGEQSE